MACRDLANWSVFRQNLMLINPNRARGPIVATLDEGDKGVRWVRAAVEPSSLHLNAPRKVHELEVLALESELYCRDEVVRNGVVVVDSRRDQVRRLRGGN